MLVHKLRQHMKWIIWVIVISFVISIFLVGAATWLDNKQAKRQNAARQAFDMEPVIDSEFDVTSKKLLAVVEAFGQKASVTEGGLNRRLLQSGMADRLRELPEQYRKMFTEQMSSDLISEELMVLKGISQGVQVEARVLGELEKAIQQNGGREQFQYALKKNGWSGIEEFKDYLKRAFIVDEINQKLFEGIKVTDEEVSLYYNLNKDSFKDASGKIPALEEVKEIIRAQLRDQVSEDQIKKYYEEHQNRWKKPGSVEGRYLILSRRNPKNRADVEALATEDALLSFYAKTRENWMSADIADVGHIFVSREGIKKELIVSEEELSAWYKENELRFTVEDRVRAHHILVKTSDQVTKQDALLRIETIASELRSGAISFEDAAKKYSEDEGSGLLGGDLGFFGKGMMVQEFENFCFSAKPGDISTPVLTQYGYHLIRLDAVQKSHVKPFEEVREEVRSGILDSQVSKKAETFIQTIQARIQSGKDRFEDLVKEYSEAPSKANGGKLEKIYLGDGNASEKIAELNSGGKGIDYPILVNLKSLRVGAVSDAVENSAGYHFLKIFKKYEPEIRSFESVREDVRAKFIDQELETSFQGRKSLVIADLEAGKPFDDMIAKYTDGIDKTGVVTGLNLSLDFDMKSFSPALRMDLGRGETIQGTLVENLRYLKEGETSKVIDLGDGRIIWFRVEKRYEGEVVALVQVRQDVVESLTLKVPPEEIKKYYEENKAKFATKASLVIQQIAYQKEDQAQGQLSQILDGSLDFNVAGKSWLNIDQSSFVQNEGKANLSETSFSQEDQDKISALEAGQIYPQLVKSPFGFHIVKVSQKSGAKDASLEEVADKIVEELKKQKKSAVLRAYFQELRNSADRIQLF